MLSKSEGIVLNHFKYTDSKQIVTILTRQFGKIPVLVYKSKKSNNCLFQPFSIINGVFDLKPNRDIQRLKDYDVQFIPNVIITDIHKNGVAQFLIEFLARFVPTEQINDVKYTYISEAIKYLEFADRSILNFHLVFLVQFSKFLGIYPGEENIFFHEFQKQFESFQLMQTSLSNSDSIKNTTKQRKDTLDIILAYYAQFFPEIRKLKSLDVLREVFS